MKAVWEPWPPAVSVKQQETKRRKQLTEFRFSHDKQINSVHTLCIHQARTYTSFLSDN